MPTSLSYPDEYEEGHRGRLAQRLFAQQLSVELAKRFAERDRIEQLLPQIETETESGWRLSPKVKGSLSRPGVGLKARHDEDGINGSVLLSPLQKRVDAEASLPFLGGDLSLRGGTSLDGNWGVGFQYRRSFR